MAVVRGTVKEWHSEEGWGVLAAPGLPDTWVHYAFLDMPGYRTLSAGDQVEFDWEPAQQDGYSARATWVRKI